MNQPFPGYFLDFSILLLIKANQYSNFPIETAILSLAILATLYACNNCAENGFLIKIHRLSIKYPYIQYDRV